MIIIKCEKAPILAESLSRNLSNLNRVSNLIENFNSTKNKDVLRICIVYLHATLEDLLRNLIFYKLQQLDDESLLSEIPLVGTAGKKEKIYLSELQKFKSLTVNDLLVQSILEYVNRQTFNNTNDIVKWFSKFHVDTKPITGSLSQLEDLFRRRHSIVHNSDLSTDRIKLNTSAQTLHDGHNEIFEDISVEFVNEKIQALSPFIFQSIKSFLPADVELTMQNA